MKTNAFITKARAKIIWGDPPSSVRDFLISNGISDSDADAAIEEFCAQRNKEIRKIGIKKTLLGVALSAVTCFVLFDFIPEMANHHTSDSPFAARGLAGVVVVIMIGGYFGLSRLIDGLFYLVSPQSVDKSLS